MQPPPYLQQVSKATAVAKSLYIFDSKIKCDLKKCSLSFSDVIQLHDCCQSFPDKTACQEEDINNENLGLVSKPTIALQINI